MTFQPMAINAHYREIRFATEDCTGQAYSVMDDRIVPSWGISAEVQVEGFDGASDVLYVHDGTPPATILWQSSRNTTEIPSVPGSNCNSLGAEAQQDELIRMDLVGEVDTLYPPPYDLVPY